MPPKQTVEGQFRTAEARVRLKKPYLTPACPRAKERRAVRLRDAIGSTVKRATDPLRGGRTRLDCR